MNHSSIFGQCLRSLRSLLCARRLIGSVCAVPVLLTLASCSLLQVNKGAEIALYSFSSTETTEANNRAGQASVPQPPHYESADPNALTIVLSIPRAAVGFETAQIVFVRHAYQLEYFSLSQWTAPPAAMLAPLISDALERSGEFKAVLQSPARIGGQLRLDVEIIRLQHEFVRTPSQVHFSLRAHLIDSHTRQVIAWREFDASLASASENPYGGVVAANQVVRTVAKQLADFCVQASRELAKPKNKAAHKTP